VSLTDRDRKILLFLVPLVVLGAYWFLLLSPKREEASTAAVTLQEQRDRLEAARGLAGTADDAQQDFEASYATIVRLGKAIPPTVDMPSLLVQLEAAAAGTGIRFDTIAAGPRTAAPQAAPAETEGEPTGDAPAAEAGGEPAQTAPGGAVEAANETAAAESADAAAADGSTETTGDDAAGTAAAPAPATPPPGLETVPLSLEFEGNFFKLADFFHDLKRFVQVANEQVLVSGRLISVDGVRWASDPEIFPQVRAEVTATVYLSPLAQGVTAGATPTGPAPTTPAAAPTTPAETAPAAAPAPTATATP
jgi:Tfp pilus assembly protein PilO